MIFRHIVPNVLPLSFLFMMFGVTEAIMEELSELPINAYTSGNHIWDKKDFVDNYDHYPHVIRPANYPAGNPGKGKVIRQTAAGVNVAVLQLMGNVFMPPIDNPFYCADRELAAIGPEIKVIIVDIHGNVGAVPFVSDGPWSPFTALPIQIFAWVSRPHDGFRANAAAAILVLAVGLLALVPIILGVLAARDELVVRRMLGVVGAPLGLGEQALV